MSSGGSLYFSSEEIPSEPEISVMELIQRSKAGLESQDATRVRAYLKRLRKVLQDPEKLKPVLHSEFRAFLQMSLTSSLEAVPAEAVALLTGSLEALSQAENSEENAGLIKVLLRFIKLDIIAVSSSSSDMLVIAFDALNRWSCLGLKRAKMLLEVFSIDFLDEIHLFDRPGIVSVSYVSLIASLARHSHALPDLLPTVLRIFTKSLRVDGYDDTCEIARIICEAMTSISESPAFGGTVIDQVLDSRLVAALVRHVMAMPMRIVPEFCFSNCLTAMMKMLVNFTAWSLEQCERFVDQGILLAIERSLAGGISETRFSAMTLTNVFAYCPYSIEYAMNSSLAERLFVLREVPESAIRKEALRASSNFISRASCAQLFSMVKMGYVTEITKLLQSPHPEVVCHGLQALLAFVGAANFTNPLKLPVIHEMLRKQNVDQMSDALRAHNVKEIRLAAIAVHKFMTSYLDEAKLGCGTRPKWSGMSRELNSSDLESVMSLPI